MAKKLSPITPGDVLLEEFLKPMEISQNQYNTLEDNMTNS
jgi:plasmid maintenance system antidote protein VapI